MARLVYRPPANFAAANAAPVATLGLASQTVSVGTAAVKGTRATAPLSERLRFARYGSWTVRSTLRLRLVRHHWKVVWTPATINPAFGSTGSYAVSYAWPRRAAILAANGTPISAGTPTSVVIGLEGQYLKSPTSVASTLEQDGATATEVNTAVAAAHANPSAFEAVFTVPWARYQQLEPTLSPIPGVFFQAQGGGGSTPPALASVVGTLGTITKAQLKSLGPPYTASSTVGTSGLEQAFERRLAGSPGLTIRVQYAGTSTNGSGTGPSPGRVLKTFPAKPGRPVRTTIDMTAEQDAASALSHAPGAEAALIAIQASTGKILAVANSSQTDDLALEGEQPPGSTMKIITSTALIEKGLTPQSPATCPPTINVDGENFHNAGNEGSVPNMLQAFTVSCNTAYIGMTVANLDFHSLHDAALVYRIGTPLRVGMPVFSGSVPVDNGQTDFAAAAIGQARVVMNPLDLAMVAADVDTGTVRTPWLAFGAPAEHQKTAPLPSNLVSDLHEMMLSVVLNGTASGTGLPAGTHAKTGTAEYGSGNPLPLDGWLAGFNGNIAFAMIDVNAPGDGGPVDGPIVAQFLNALGPAK
jgi:cell division protein FtsI/penicillin-binding protein 2